MKPGLIVLKDKYMIYQPGRDQLLPERPDNNEFYSVTTTNEEVSVVCRQISLPAPLPEKVVGNRRIIKVEGPVPFNVTGIIAGISGILSENSIPLFTVSTYNTDYLLIDDNDLSKALTVLKESGYTVNILT